MMPALRLHPHTQESPSRKAGGNGKGISREARNRWHLTRQGGAIHRALFLPRNTRGTSYWRSYVFFAIGTAAVLAAALIIRGDSWRPPAPGTTYGSSQGSSIEMGALAPAQAMDTLNLEAQSQPGLPIRKPNRLINEQSPYLLQHAYNPVDWYPWGDEAFAAAKKEDKPVFLSIGYSTCYWCHVMEEESFSNPEVANVINASVIPIKVDREERPDIDAIYMTALQAMTAQGGWPLNIFLTPGGKPFWGGTYFPPEDRRGRAGLKNVIRSISESWKTKRKDILQSSEQLTSLIQAQVKTQEGELLSKEVLDRAVREFSGQYDAAYGGFGSAPKFPRSHIVSFLLHAWYRSRDPKILEMAETTLTAMADGGIHDQLGGGFHRYSTDASWLVPHFEKMLYDQAILARSYLEVYQATGETQYANVARDIFRYVLSDLRYAKGAFYSAEDAGEMGKEGEFYLWRPEEIRDVLDEEQARLFIEYYNVTRGGNFEHKNILHVSQPLEGIAKRLGLSIDAAEKKLSLARTSMLEARGERERPRLDDKILTDWNGLMIASLAYGARVLGDKRYAQTAQEAAAFILERVQRDKELMHRYRNGNAAIPAYLNDYAFLNWGLLDLYEATFDARWLKEAKRLTEKMVQLFWDEKEGGFFFSGDQNEELIARTKDIYDGALPSGNSVAVLALVRLGQLTMDKTLQRYADEIMKTFSGQISQVPHNYPQFLIAVDGWLGPSQEIVIAGDPSASKTEEMIRLVGRYFLPHATLVLRPTGEEASAIIELVPFTESQRPIKGQPTAYICENYTCNLPTADLAKMTSLLEAL